MNKKFHYVIVLLVLTILFGFFVTFCVLNVATVVNWLTKTAKTTEHILAVSVVGTFLIIYGILIGKLSSRIKDEQSIRQDALARSKAVLSGLATEQVAPFLPNFPCSPADARFIGKPVDFVAFSGMSKKSKIDEILLIEVKTGSSNLSDIERQVKKAVEDGRVSYVEWRMK